MSALGDMMREVLEEYHEHVGHGILCGAMYVKPMGYSNERHPAFHIVPFGSYKRIRKEYLVFKSYDNELWEFHEIPF